MQVHANVCLKVPFSTALIDSMQEFSKATQYAYTYAHRNKVTSWKILHQKIYSKIRSFSKLPSQLCCKAIKSAIETKKSCKNRKAKFNEELAIQYDQRSYSFDFSGKCSLSSVDGRIKQQLYVPEYYLKNYGDWTIRSATLSKCRKNLFLNITVTRNILAARHTSSSKCVGIDLGINNLAVTSDAMFFKGVKIEFARFQRLRTRLQMKGTKSAKRHLKKLSGKQKRFMKSINHEISKRIASSIGAGDIIVMEKLHGIRARKRGKTLNGLISNWAFYQLRTFIEYKAIRRRAIFMVVPPAYSSKTCNRCNDVLSKRPKNAGFFRCLNCGYSCNADFNASLNLKKRVNAMRNTLGLLVNQPIVAESFSQPLATSS